MSRDARAWLAGRAGAVPPTLQSAMESAAATQSPETRLPRALGDAALRAAVAALARCDERDAALTLLAADALVTAACEAAADSETELEHLCATFAPERLASLLPSEAP
jgi:hypothetical protein